MNKSITFFSNNFWTLYKFRYEVILLLSKTHDINLIGKYDGYEKKFIFKNISNHNVPLEERGYNPFKEFILFYKIFRIYKNLKSDLFFHYTIKPNLYGSLCARYFGYNYVSFITGLGSIFIQSNIFLKQIIIYFYRISLKKVNQVWFTNNSDQHLFESLKIVNSSIKSKIVPGCGIHKSFFINNKNSISKRNITMISRIQKEKGVQNFLDLSMKYKENDINFYLIGEHDTNDPSNIPMHTLDFYIKNNCIEYIPYTDQITDFYDLSDCFILPSYREGISTVLLEAAARCVPIITTNVPGCIDVIPDESYGFLCQVNNTDSLHKAFIRYLDTPLSELTEMTKKTNKYVKNQYDRDIILSHYISLVRSL